MIKKKFTMFTSSLAFTSSLVQVLFIHRFLLSHLDGLAPNKAQTGLQETHQGHATATQPEPAIRDVGRV